MQYVLTNIIDLMQEAVAMHEYTGIIILIIMAVYIYTGR
jgi:hypothetical protein